MLFGNAELKTQLMSQRDSNGLSQQWNRVGQVKPEVGVSEGFTLLPQVPFVITQMEEWQSQQSLGEVNLDQITWGNYEEGVTRGDKINEKKILMTQG